MSKHDFMTVKHFHAVDAQTVRQTIAESDLECPVDMGAFTVYHGTRYGAPIVIVEHHDQQPDELSAIWFNDDQ
jgi:hypothetical protein